MHSYNDLSLSQGREYLPNVWNLIFKPLDDLNFYVEPWENRALRDCTEFRLSNDNDVPDEIRFFVADQELANFLKATSGELYLFGAFNQVTVCQMRARGTVTLAEQYPHIDKIKARLRTQIEARVDAFSNQISEEEARERYAILDNGLLFCFQVEAYAYNVYDRG